MKNRYEEVYACQSESMYRHKDLVNAGIPRGTLSRISREDVRPETAGKIAKALGVDVTELSKQKN